nr:NepR family anti-sigma factor [Oryzicola mucosus]
MKNDGKRPPHVSDGGDPLGTNSQIGLKLKQYYADLVSEEVPDRFADLLRQLEQTPAAAKKG